MKRRIVYVLFGLLSLAYGFLPDGQEAETPALEPQYRPFIRHGGPAAPDPDRLDPATAQCLYCLSALFGALAVCLFTYTFINTGRT